MGVKKWQKSSDVIYGRPINPLKRYAKNQEVSWIFRIDFALLIDLISLHKHAMQRFHMNVAVFETTQFIQDYCSQSGIRWRVSNRLCLVLLRLA